MGVSLYGTRILVVPTAECCTVPGLYGRDLNILLSFFFVKQEEGVYVLYALSLDGLSTKLTEIGRSDPSAYLAAAAAVVDGHILQCARAVRARSEYFA